jgi:hypothetical protein
MSPVERQMLQGSVQATGWDWQDYLQAAQRSAPKTAFASTRWAR